MRKGFTLLEISVVLVIIALITGMAVSSGVMMVGSARDSSTRMKMRAIETALASYRAANNRLPCPADLTMMDGAANFGVEGATSGTCTGGTPSANYSGAGVTNAGATGVEGALPVVTLGLPNDMTYDGWGYKFRYVVDKSVTATNAFASSGGCSSGAITVKDANGAARSGGAVYALISSGANGHGGYTKQGVMTNAASINTDEQTNCHCDSTAVSTAFAPTYVQKNATRNSSTLSDTFDDIVTYKERWQLANAWDAAQNCGSNYLYVTDNGNNRVCKFKTDGTFVKCYGGGYNLVTGTKGVAGSSNGQLNSPFQEVVDSAGNLYVADYLNGRVVKYDKNGNFVLNIGSNGTAHCPSVGAAPTFDWNYYYAPGGVAIDSTGSYLLISDTRSATVLKVSTSTGLCLESPSRDQGYGPYTMYMDSTNSYVYTHFTTGYQVDKHPNDQVTWYPAVAGTSPSGGGSGNGAFFNTMGSCCDGDFMSIDPNDTSHIWVSDEENFRIQQFSTSTLAYTAKCTMPGSGSHGPTGVTFDQSSNMYVSNESDNRIYKYQWNGSSCVAQNSYSGVNYFDCTSSGMACNSIEGVLYSNY